MLRTQPAAGAPCARPAWGDPPGHSTLVEVLMWEDDIDAAWQVAQHGGCSRPLWLRLARARAEKHPADAMPILRREVLAAIEGEKRPAYQTAAQFGKGTARVCPTRREAGRFQRVDPPGTCGQRAAALGKTSSPSPDSRAESVPQGCRPARDSVRTHHSGPTTGRADTDDRRASCCWRLVGATRKGTCRVLQAEKAAKAVIDFGGER